MIQNWNQLLGSLQQWKSIFQPEPISAPLLTTTRN